MPVGTSSSRPDGLDSSQQQQYLELEPGEEYATAEQSAAAEMGQLKMLDVQEVADRWVHNDNQQVWLQHWQDRVVVPSVIVASWAPARQ
jgi:hypothetical protein